MPVVDIVCAFVDVLQLLLDGVNLVLLTHVGRSAEKSRNLEVEDRWFWKCDLRKVESLTSILKDPGRICRVFPSTSSCRRTSALPFRSSSFVP